MQEKYVNTKILLDVSFRTQFQENTDFSRKSTFNDSLPIISQKS